MHLFLDDWVELTDSKVAYYWYIIKNMAWIFFEIPSTLVRVTKCCNFGGFGGDEDLNFNPTLCSCRAGQSCPFHNFRFWRAHWTSKVAPRDRAGKCVCGFSTKAKLHTWWQTWANRWGQIHNISGQYIKPFFSTKFPDFIFNNMWDALFKMLGHRSTSALPMVASCLGWTASPMTRYCLNASFFSFSQISVFDASKI